MLFKAPEFQSYLLAFLPPDFSSISWDFASNRPNHLCSFSVSQGVGEECPCLSQIIVTLFPAWRQ